MSSVVINNPFLVEELLTAVDEVSHDPTLLSGAEKTAVVEALHLKLQTCDQFSPLLLTMDKPEIAEQMRPPEVPKPDVTIHGKEVVALSEILTSRGNRHKTGLVQPEFMVRDKASLLGLQIITLFLVNDYRKKIAALN